MQFIHEAGVIHLDLKPSNIFVTAEGRFKIGDFGMASLWPRSNKQDKGTGSSGFEREGDKVYLAPEVLQGEYGKAADVFRQVMVWLEFDPVLMSKQFWRDYTRNSDQYSCP